jgi:hypothetical protein
MISGTTSSTASDSLSALRRFAHSSPQAVERCELCGTALDAVHPHLLERSNRRIVCGCEACSILFSDRDDGRYLRIPRRARSLAGFSFTDLEWEALTIPINLAFFFRDSAGGINALYPSPAGAIESQLPMTALAERFASARELQAMKPEVEALLVNRIGGTNRYMIVPIDECFRLVGLIRAHWRGLSGGKEVWVAVAEFFEQLERNAAGQNKESHA